MAAYRKPEWTCYVAAFQTLVDAKARGDQEQAHQAILILWWFARALLAQDVKRGLPPHYEGQSEFVRDLLSVLDIHPKDRNGTDRP